MAFSPSAASIFWARFPSSSRSARVVVFFGGTVGAAGVIFLLKKSSAPENGRLNALALSLSCFRYPEKNSRAASPDLEKFKVAAFLIVSHAETPILLVSE